MKFIMFKGSLEEGVAPIYLFDGEEEYFKRRGEEMLKQKYLTEPSLNYSIFDGAELKGSRLTELIAAAQSFPFLSEKRIVKVAGLYPTEKEYETYLRPYFEHPCDTTILLIVNGEGKAKGFDLKKAPNVTRVDCSRADEETVLRWIYTRMRRAGVACNTDCANALCGTASAVCRGLQRKPKNCWRMRGRAERLRLKTSMPSSTAIQTIRSMK